MTVTSESVKEFAVREGAALVGVAQVERFRGAPPGHHPTDILAGAKSVVVCAIPIPAGIMHGPATSYQSAFNAVHSRLDQLAARVALFLESEGGKAVPVPADEPYRHWDADKSYGYGDLSHKHAAQAAGLGRLGRNSLLVTPGFGNRVHLVSVVTDVALAPDPPMEGEPCPETCRNCLEACPAGAIGEGRLVNQTLCRPVLIQKLPKGGFVEGCWACRMACPL